MKRPTQHDVAKFAGVSRATVSYVLNGLNEGRVLISEETNKKVIEAIEELGYVPDASAQALRRGSTKTLGLIIPDMDNPHYWEYANGAEKEALASGYRLLLSSMELNIEHGEDIFKDLSRQRIDGLILMGSFVSRSEKSQKTLNQFLKRQLSIVEIRDNTDTDNNLDRVSSDYYLATKEVMAHLLSLGHRQIGLVYGVQEPVLAEDRLLPYQESLRAAGLLVQDDLIIRCGTTIQDGYQAAESLLKRSNKPTALIAVNDLLAIGAMRAAIDIGLKIPQDLSVVGYDDILLAKFMAPRLTTVSKDAVGVGRAAVKLLLARIQEPDRPRQMLNVSPRVIIRESTGPAEENSRN
ncbi:MAG: LacI family transcriptional regulator [Chloroflexota bacterium]|nr:LacI family transcriptional regulator [Chloroflexota bacterium]